MKLTARETLESISLERKVSIIFLSLVAGLTVFDVIEDSIEGVSLQHVLLELGIITAAIAGAAYLAQKAYRDIKSSNKALRSELQNVKQDNLRWKSENAQLYKGFETAVESQLKSWGLSAAECDVAFMILKGLSLKEIADVRHSSERTVRQQAACVYKKSNLEGRAQLAAFFLEDLFDGPRASTSTSEDLAEESSGTSI
jgi:DNA-binding NarL/FixJ family response regulator